MEHQQEDMTIHDYEVGKKIIETSIKIDESLAELLKVEVRIMKQLLKNNSLEELKNSRNVIKNIILALMLSDEKIRYGINLYKSKNHK